MRYGIPYKGSKNSIAEWVISTLPNADTFVDLFAGGCAITHAAMLSGKYNHFIANDISGSTILFKDAINGEFKDFSQAPSRHDFFLSDDAIVKLLYSFGNDSSSYIWGDFELIKVNASKMISAPSLHERRMYYMKFMKELYRYVNDIVSCDDICVDDLRALKGLDRLQGIERLERVNGIIIPENSGALDVMVSDYRNVNIPANSVVYADPPYRNTSEHYGGFDFDAFDEWLQCVDFPVFISEYDAPTGCVCIAEVHRHSHMAAFGSGEATERIFVQERFAINSQ